MKNTLCHFLIMAVLGGGTIADAQQLKKISLIGILSPASEPSTPVFEAFRHGLRELGYLEGKTIVIEYRFAEGKSERLPTLAQELVHLKVDIIIADGGIAARAAKQATATIPIVMGAVGDPVAIGLVAGLARPGGNITGFSLLSRELNGKRLEILKEAFPKVTRIAVLWDSATPGAKTVGLKETEVVAQAVAVQVHAVEVRSSTDFENVFESLIRLRPGALMSLSSAMFWNHRARIVKLAAKSRLPAMYPEKEFVDEGGLMSYGPSVPDNFRRAATYVDKILKGTKPADLPVQQPMKFEFVVNLKTAKQIGLTIEPNVLVRADNVIK